MTTGFQKAAKHRSSAVLILASEWRLPYRALRCAAPCFDRVHVLGTREARPLARSRFCQSFHYLPFTNGFDGTSIPFINRLCDQLLVDWVIPSDPRTTSFLAGNKATLGAKAFPVPDAATFELLNDKSAFISLCRQLGIPTPLTEVFADKKQLLNRLQRGQFKLPLVVKPIGMEGGRGVAVLQADGALRVAGRLAYEPIMVQEFIRGRDLCAFYLCRKGEVELEVLYHHGGHFIEFIEHREVGEQCRRIIEAIRYEGVVGFDIRQSELGDLYFIECNPRFWYNMELTMLAGINFVAAGIKDPKLADRQLNTKLAGKVVSRPSGLLRKLPASQSGKPTRLTVLGYLMGDFPMMVSIGLSKAVRTVGTAMQARLQLGPPNQASGS